MEKPIVTRPARRAPPPVGRYTARLFAELAARTRYVDPTLAAQWPAIVGAELAGLCRPGRLGGGRIGRTLEVVAPHGAAAARVQFEASAIRERVNAVLGPGVVGRIAVRQSASAARGTGGSDDLGAALSRFRASVGGRDGGREGGRDDGSGG